MKTKYTITVIVLSLAALILCSCNNPIGLGTRLNMTPPTVTINNPDYMQNVGESFIIEGIATDEEEVSILSITVQHISTEDNGWKQEWYGERGAWRSRSSAHPQWELKNGKGIWTSLQEKGNISWSVEVSMKDTPNGEYLISVGVENSVKKTGTVQQRRVVKDTSPPAVTVINPVMQLNVNEFDSYKLQDPSVLALLHNKHIPVQYEVSDDFSLSSLYFQLADAAGNIYHNKDGKLIDNVGWSGKITIPAAEIIDADENPVTEKMYLQLLSTVTDKAGNSQTRSHGWLVWWPDADKPWVTGIGHEDDPQKFKVYPGSAIQGQTYDNDGVHSVTWKIYPKDSDQILAEDTFINEPLEEGAAPAAFFNWSITSPLNCAEYRIVMDCIDMYGTPGDTVTRYFYVYDVDAPSITLTGPTENESLFGDNAGNFKLTGTVGDGVEPKKLTLVWFNPNAGFDSRTAYQSADYPGWNTIGGQDSDGNRIWDLPLGANTLDTATGRHTKTFEQNFNLFTDLGIGTWNYLTTQTFILRVEGSSGRALTELHSARGDIQPPALTIDHIVVTRTGEPDKEYETEDLVDTFMSALAEGDTITVSGTWNDDSMNLWQDPARMPSFEVIWDSKKSEAFSVVKEYSGLAGTWKAGPLEFTGEMDKKGGLITASLTDSGHNLVQKTFTARADTETPYLSLINSSNPDGAYGVGKEIQIYLEFSRAVTYAGGSQDPTLTLNNGKTAVYDVTSNTTNRHIFTYQVQEGDANTDELTVEFPINAYDGIWSVAGSTVDVSKIDNSNNLGALRDIKIDTTAPNILQVTSLSGNASITNYYNKGKSITLRLTFDEPINFTAGDGAQMKLNSGESTEVLTRTVKGQSTLEFIYNVDTGNTPSSPSSYLVVDSLTMLSGARITDIAGNDLTSMSIPVGKNIADNNGIKIVIDTVKPPTPTVTKKDDKTFTIASHETGAEMEYRLSDTGSWISFPSGNGDVKLSNSGKYKVTAQQTDQAKNVSESSDPPIELEIKSTDPLVKLLSGSPSGTYGPNSTVIISFVLREPVTVTGGTPTITLNARGGSAEAAFDSVSDNTLIFKYTVQSGDDIEPLEITGIALNGTKLTSQGGADVTSEFPSTYTLSPTRIIIDTQIPVLEDTNLTGNTLTLTFDKPIFKGSGTIELVQEAGTYLAPAVLDKDTYSRFGSDAALGTWYEARTNGTDSSGTPDLTEKYVLKYDYDTDNSHLVIALKAAGADKVSIPVVSGAVTVNDDKLEIDVSDTYGYAPYVKGVNYAVQFNMGVVVDSQGKQVAKEDSTKHKEFVSGVNVPFIRVKKDGEGGLTETSSMENIFLANKWFNSQTGALRDGLDTAGLLRNGISFDLNTEANKWWDPRSVYSTKITGGSASSATWADDNWYYFDTTMTNLTLTDTIMLTKTTMLQPLNTVFKIDCQTPQTELKYTCSPSSTDAVTSFPNAPSVDDSPKVSMPSSAGTGYVNAVDITLNDITNGYRIGIMAQAKKGSYEAVSYEVANRSVIQFTPPALPSAPTGKVTQLWLRGGQNKDGGDNLTSDFPLAWKESDTKGIKLMTKDDVTGVWYWISWEVNTTAYFHFIAGTTTTAAEAENGPWEWSWSKNAWSFFKQYYPLYPGGSVKLDSSDNDIPELPTGGYMFPAFSGKR